MEWIKKNWWWVLCLALGALGAWLSFMPTEKEIQLAEAREEKKRKADERKAAADGTTVDVEHVEVKDEQPEAPAANGAT